MAFPELLRINTTYIHSGDTFSRVFLIYKGLPDGKKLLIFDTKKDAVDFSKTLSLVTNKKSEVIFDSASLLNFLSSDDGIFVTMKEFFTLPINGVYLQKKYTRILSRNDEILIDDLIDTIIDFGYTHSLHLAKPGTYKKEWDTVSIRSPLRDTVISVSFFDTTIDEILIFDTLGSFLGKKESSTIISLHGNQDFSAEWTGRVQNPPIICDNLGDTIVIFIDLDFFDTLKSISNWCRQFIILSGVPNGEYSDLAIKEPKIESLTDLENIVKTHGNHVHFYTKHWKALRNFLEYNAISCQNIIDTSISGITSFVSKEASLEVEYYITDDVLGRIFIRNRTKKSISKNLDLLLEIRPNDYVVHRDHGIWIFSEIVEKTLGGNKREYMAIEYAANDKLFVPLWEIHRVSKYVGEESPKLTRLSGGEWKKVIDKTNEDIERIAHELLDIYAKRRMARGFPFLVKKREELWFREAFKYKHTPDQISAILDIFEDMESGEPMDRLLSGDVWFGKTEVAMNALYKAFLSGKQSAFISPLVVLAYEHFESLQGRFAGFWVRLAVMTRLTSGREIKMILEWLRNGEIDCVVGTHRLLGEDIIFKNLWLLVIDEEHRFWVLDKEKINTMKSNIDILSLSATPIPRSLNLALSGVKKISVLATPPPMKKSISTLVVKWNEEVIKNVIEREFERGGQVIFIHNRVASIDSIKTQLISILGKKVRIAITHGKMNGIDLEDRIIDFKHGKYDILLSTTVIENGVNFLNANTIIIDDAEKFGLAQLHQLRGRVWRKDQEAFCHLVYHSERLDDQAKKRLLTIVNHSELGAGFEIALRDLEIRGVGDILGIKQSGKTSDTGLSLYLKLLEEKIEELQCSGTKITSDCTIELDLSYFIPDDFFDSELDKIRFFRSIESMETSEDLTFAYRTFDEANDSLPETFENLFLLLRARLKLREYGIISLKKVWWNYVFDFNDKTKIEMIRSFLNLDQEGNFALVTIHKIKVGIKHYQNDADFLKRLLF